MPDPLPEHRENPPQWPPLAGTDEPTTPPEPADAIPPVGDIHPPALRTDDDPETGQRGPVPSQAGAPDEPPPGGGLSDRPPAAEQPKTTPAPPDTHGRGVRMTIYGFGGAVVVGLIAVIVVMAGGGLVAGKDGDEPADKLLTDSGEVSKQEYLNLAKSAGSKEWVQWRYGAAGSTDKDVPKVKQPKHSTAMFPGSDFKHPYQLGTGEQLANPRNVQGQLGYVAENPGKKPSADHVTTVETTDSTIGFTPRAGGRFTAEAQDPDLTSDQVADCAGGGGPGQLVATDRAHGNGFEAHAVMAFSSGVITTSGISGAQQGACLQLPQGQVPTSVAVTPANEFALVTVWDTKEVRGRVAVVAMGDSPGTYGSSWPKTYPGLPSPGHFGFAKLLGFVDLEDTKAPTSITASTNFAGNKTNRVNADLSSEQSRAAYSKDVATSGFALVASTAERKLEWLDLKPLLSNFHKSYFKGDPGVYASPGTKAKQWPPAFETAADFKPKVVKVDEVDDAVDAVTSSKGTAFVADRAGTVNSFTVKDPSKPTEAGSLKLDGAVSCMTPTADGEEVLATSRQDRSVSWISPSKKGLSTSQSLRDERLEDPICATDNHSGINEDGSGTQVRTVSIADFGGGALHTYRYGAATMADGSSEKLKDDVFEYGGSYEPKGSPFAITTTVDNI